jgi:hypothetical protein
MGVWATRQVAQVRRAPRSILIISIAIDSPITIRIFYAVGLYEFRLGHHYTEHPRGILYGVIIIDQR